MAPPAPRRPGEVGDDFSVEAVTADRWSDLVDLFERAGPRGGIPMPGASCWCMWWRQRTGDARQNRRAMQILVETGTEPGLLAYADGVPVGWVSVGPRESFGQLMRSPQYRPRDSDELVDAIVCFYVDPRWKGTGVTGALLDGAVAWSRRRGAAAIEAYPNLKPDFMGRRDSFEERGFVEMRQAGKRTVLRLALVPSG